MSASDCIAPVEYRQISESEGYRFGDDGSIWSQWGSGRRRPDGPWNQLCQSLHKSGHYHLRVKINGAMANRWSHQLICRAFKGPCPEGLECLHKDGNPANNRPDNLHWGTRAANIRDQFTHDVFARGERCGLAKATEDQVREIRRIYAAGGISMRRLAPQFGLSFPAARQIIRRQTWKHVG